MKVTQLDRAYERAEVEDRDVRSGAVEHCLKLAVGHVVCDQVEAVVLGDQRAQAASDDVLEAGDQNLDGAAAWHFRVSLSTQIPRGGHG